MKQAYKTPENIEIIIKFPMKQAYQTPLLKI